MARSLASTQGNESFNRLSGGLYQLFQFLEIIVLRRPYCREIPPQDGEHLDGIARGISVEPHHLHRKFPGLHRGKGGGYLLNQHLEIEDRYLGATDGALEVFQSQIEVEFVLSPLVPEERAFEPKIRI